MEIVSAGEAVGRIAPRSTVAVGGSGSLLQVADNLLKALAERFEATGDPRDLVLVHTMGLGDNADRGLERLAKPGLLRRVIGSHYGHNPTLARQIAEGAVEAFGVPGGVLSLLYRDIAGGRPGHITRTGLRTYVDPRIEGGRLNSATPGSLASLLSLRDQELLFYPSLSLDVGLLRATAADLSGNLIMDEEAGFADNLALAMAVHASGGLVIAEVKYIAERHSFDPRTVKVPGILVDLVVEDPNQWQTPVTRYSPFRAGRMRSPVHSVLPLPLDARKVIARRAACELFSGAVVNLGTGVPTGIASVLAEEGLTDSVTLTIEQGMIGGIPGTGLDSGTALNAEAFIDEGYQFDFYGGGGLDICFVSFGEVDGLGNVNVSKLGGRAVGPGGFIDITQGARHVVFCGTLTGGDLAVAVGPGGLSIQREGRYRKFVASVGQVTFSGPLAIEDGRPVSVVTERAAFELGGDGLILTEIAPGVDLKRDILDQVDCRILVSQDLRLMPIALFSEAPLSSEGLDLIHKSRPDNGGVKAPDAIAKDEEVVQ